MLSTQFWNAGASATAGLVVASAAVQPAFKALACALCWTLPLTPNRAAKAIALQEAVGKLTMATFYVEALMLVLFSIQVRTFSPLMPGRVCWALHPCWAGGVKVCSSRSRWSSAPARSSSTRRSSRPPRCAQAAESASR